MPASTLSSDLSSGLGWVFASVLTTAPLLYPARVVISAATTSNAINASSGINAMGFSHFTQHYLEFVAQGNQDLIIA